VDAGRAALFFLGIALTVGGAFILSQVRASSDDSSRSTTRVPRGFGVEKGAARGGAGTAAAERDERQRRSLLTGGDRGTDAEEGLGGDDEATLDEDEDAGDDRCGGGAVGVTWERERALTASVDGRSTSGSTGET